MTENPLLKIRPATKENLSDIVSAANADDHSAFWPTDIVIKDNEIVGYVSIANVPSVHMWLHHEKVKVRDSKEVLTFIEATLARQNIKHFWLPCQTYSPLFPFVERLGGYEKTNYDNLFVGTL